MGRKNFWILLIMLLAGIVLGGFIGQLADGISWLKWMNYGQSFGLGTPLLIDFGLLVILSWTYHQDYHGQALLEWQWLCLFIK